MAGTIETGETGNAPSLQSHRRSTTPPAQRGQRLHPRRRPRLVRARHGPAVRHQHPRPRARRPRSPAWHPCWSASTSRWCRRPAAERILLVTGMIAGFVGLALGLAHGGFSWGRTPPRRAHYPLTHDAYRRPLSLGQPARRRGRVRRADRAVLPRRPAGVEGAGVPRRRPRRAQGRLRRRRRGHLHPRAVHHQRGVDQQPHPHPEQEAARPAAQGGGLDRGEGPDRARRPRHRRRRSGPGRRELGQGRAADRATAAAADREHRGRQRRDGPLARRDRPALGRGERGRRGRRRGRLLPGHLPRLLGRHRAGRRRRPGEGDHRPDRPGALQQLARRVRLGRGPARELRLRAPSTRRPWWPWSAPPAPRWSARPPNPAWPPTSPGSATRPNVDALLALFARHGASSRRLSAGWARDRGPRR